MKLKTGFEMTPNLFGLIKFPAEVALPRDGIIFSAKHDNA